MFIAAGATYLKVSNVDTISSKLNIMIQPCLQNNRIHAFREIGKQRSVCILEDGIL